MWSIRDVVCDNGKIEEITDTGDEFLVYSHNNDTSELSNELYSFVNEEQTTALMEIMFNKLMATMAEANESDSSHFGGENANVNKLMNLDTNDYKIVWLHSEEILKQDNQSWIETHVRMIVPKAEIFSSIDLCLAFLDSLSVDTKIIFLGSGDKPDQVMQMLRKFSEIELLWNSTLSHTIDSFITMQEKLIERLDAKDEALDIKEQKDFEKSLNNYTVILFDENIQDESSNKIKDRLNAVFDLLLVFDEKQTCFNYIESIIDTNTNLFLILSNYTGTTIPIAVSRIKGIYCINSVAFLSAKHFCDIEKLIAHLRRHVRSLFDTLPFGIIQKSVRQIDRKLAPYSSFMGFLDVFLGLACDDDIQKVKNDFFTACRSVYMDNPAQLRTIDQFAQEYQSFEQAVQWYTRDSFIYRLVNQALRTQNPDIICKYRFFIKDLTEHLNVLHQTEKENVCKDTMLVTYRGQGMRSRELNRLKRHIGNELALNSFYSTTIDQETAIEFAVVSGNGADILPVLFILRMDRGINNTRPFASVEHLSIIPSEREVLICMGSRFRLLSLKFDESIGIWVVELTLLENDKDDIKEFKKDSTNHTIKLNTYGGNRNSSENDDRVHPFFSAAIHDTLLANEYLRSARTVTTTIQDETNTLKENMKDIFEIYGQKN